ncbi:hypothetical protein [Xanthobacter sp. 126]|jgi:hypothetical protein|uniref:UGSC family (seleno)protein n=1 Tax=Xanthobacter sp. 126 TaxID=1131814 RepID=UPI00045E78C4|nr:hypothetical protein [Xanthobacter sp. 126]
MAKKRDPIILHDPTAEGSATIRERRPPLTTLDGKVVCLMGIGKTRTEEFLDYLDKRFKARGITTMRARKPTNAKPATVDILQHVASNADVVVQGLAD